MLYNFYLAMKNSVYNSQVLSILHIFLENQIKYVLICRGSIPKLSVIKSANFFFLELIFLLIELIVICFIRFREY